MQVPRGTVCRDPVEQYVVSRERSRWRTGARNHGKPEEWPEACKENEKRVIRVLETKARGSFKEDIKTTMSGAS